jgi:putative tryptophan/tyrosine transport system substrate-binding protein
MRRREFIAGLGGVAAWPLAARAQQSVVPVIGFLSSASPGQDAGRLRAFLQGLSEAGYIEGRNVAIEYRWADEQTDRLPTLAADLVDRKVAVIATAGATLGAVAAKGATTTIPIVFATGTDPVQRGLVASLNRPGGNVTGVTTLAVEVESKRLELLHELLPLATKFAVLVNPTGSNAETLPRELQLAARTLGVELEFVNVSSAGDFATAFATSVRRQVGGVLITTDALFISRGEQLATLALRYAMPTVFQYREFAQAGGLMSYGGSSMDTYRLVGNYTGRILKGEKPADLPVQRATRVELFINMKTAKALGLTFPLTLLGRADEVIE